MAQNIASDSDGNKEKSDTDDNYFGFTQNAADVDSSALKPVSDSIKTELEALQFRRIRKTS